MITVSRRPLLPTGEAAKLLGVGRETLRRWWRKGLVTPVVTTPAGAARWDVDQLIAQLNALRESDAQDHP